jgi:hypothetical protein
VSESKRASARNRAKRRFEPKVQIYQKGVTAMKLGKNLDLQLEDCKGNIFIGGWEFVPGCANDAVDIDFQFN